MAAGGTIPAYAGRRKLLEPLLTVSCREALSLPPDKRSSDRWNRPVSGFVLADNPGVIARCFESK